MKFTIYQIDAFTSKLFGGNPAAVIPLSTWLDDKLMQQIAMENNLSETVFFVPSQNKAADFEIRWFTPEVEINLCGHATLASAYVLFNILNFDKPEIRFSSLSGILKVTGEKQHRAALLQSRQHFLHRRRQRHLRHQSRLAGVHH